MSTRDEIAEIVYEACKAHRGDIYDGPSANEAADAIFALFGEPIGVVMRGREGKPIWGTAEDVRHPIPAFHIPLYALNTEPERDE